MRKVDYEIPESGVCHASGAECSAPEDTGRSLGFGTENTILEKGIRLEKAIRHNEGKLQWSLVDESALEDMVRVLGFGSQKYSPDNWKKGMPVKTIYDSMRRHEVAFMSGEDLDLESGLPHTAHILCNAMFLAWMVKNKPEFDNRRSKGSD